MAIIRKKELNQMSEEILKSRLMDLRKELIKINAQVSTGTLPENPGRVREVKRTIARILTKINLKNRKGEVEKPKEVEKQV